jgi:hypothetical protein
MSILWHSTNMSQPPYPLCFDMLYLLYYCVSIFTFFPLNIFPGIFLSMRPVLSRSFLLTPKFHTHIPPSTLVLSRIANSVPNRSWMPNTCCFPWYIPYIWISLSLKTASKTVLNSTVDSESPCLTPIFAPKFCDTLPSVQILFCVSVRAIFVGLINFFIASYSLFFPVESK